MLNIIVFVIFVFVSSHWNHAHSESESINIIHIRAALTYIGGQLQVNKGGLLLSCNSDNIKITLITGIEPQLYKHKPDGGVAILQFDDDESFRYHLLPSADRNEIRLEKGKWLTTELSRHRRLKIAYRSFDRQSFLMNFELNGEGNVIKSFKDRCKV